MSGRELATLLGRSEIELSQWMMGNHDFMLRSIAALEMAPGEEPLRVPGLKVDHMAPETFFIDRQKQAFPLQLS